MSDNKWTPEPWGINKHPRIENFRYSDWQPEEAIKIAYVVPKPDYDHAFECVNALAGEKDPAQFVGMGKNYIQQDRDIRKLINADPGESTYDEVYTILHKYKAAEMERRELAEQVRKLTKNLNTALDMVEGLKRINSSNANN